MSLKQQLFDSLEETQALYKFFADNDMQVAISRLHDSRGEMFKQNYQDYFDLARYQPALHFILSDVYSSLLHERRDAKITKAFSSMSRVLPESILETITKAVCFNFNMLNFDKQLVVNMDLNTDDCCYKSLINNDELKRLHVELTDDFIELTETIHYFVKKPFMRMTLKASRMPARAANLTELQEFLENCFSVFKTMRNPQTFLQDYRRRELS